MTFTWVRTLLATVILTAFLAIRAALNPAKSFAKLGTRKGWTGAMFAGVWVGFAMMAQQFGLVQTSAGKAGFFTALYLLIVPVLYMTYGKKVTWIQWGAIALGVLGLFYLSTGGNLEGGITVYDGVIMLCAFLYAGQILVVDFRGPLLDSVAFSAVQFAVATGMNFIGAMIVEGFDPSFLSNGSALISIAYVAVFSSCLAYTFQIVGQKLIANPTVSSLIMSFEAVFAAVVGFLLLGETLSWIELFGAALMFIALILANLDFSKLLKKSN